MSQKMYFLAFDKQGHYDLWVTDGTTTSPVGGLGNKSVSGVSNSGLGPTDLTVFGQQMIFGGEDALDNAASNGLWLSDGTAGGTTEVGGVSPGGPAAIFVTGDSSGLNPTNFVTFGTKAIFTGTDAAYFQGLWVTDGTQSGTKELWGGGSNWIAGSAANLTPENITAFNNNVLFDGFDASQPDPFNGLWISDGTKAGTVEIGGLKNQGVFDSGTTNFTATNFITLGSTELFDAPNAAGDNALWVTDGTATGTVEIGGVGNAGIVGAENNVGLGNGLQNAVRLGNRIFFGGADDGNATGLWTTDGTASGTIEIGGLEDAGLAPLQHPNSTGLNPTDLTASMTLTGEKVLFNGDDALGYRELWGSDGSALGTYEIGGQGVGGFLANEASNGVNPTSIVSLGNDKSVFVGYDDSNGQPSGKATLWVTDGTFAGTFEIGGLNNQGVINVNSTGFDLTNPLIGGAGLAYFTGENAAGNTVLWETDGTKNGTKVVADTNNDASVTGIYPQVMAMGPLPAAATDFSGAGKAVDLGSVPGQEVNLSSTGGGAADTVTGSNGTINLAAAAASLIGGGLLVNFVGSANSATLSGTNGNKDSIYGSKGVVTLSGAQANVFGHQYISFANGTSGNVVYIYDTKGAADTVVGSNGTIYLENAQADVHGGNDTILFLGGTGNVASLYATSGIWDLVIGSNGTVNINGAQASVVGGGDTINLSVDSSNIASLFNTNGNWDLVNGSSGTIALNNAQASVIGGGDTIWFEGASGNVVELYATNSIWDAVYGSNGVVALNTAQTNVTGGGDTIYFQSASGNVVELYATNSNWDAVYGSNGVVALSTAQTNVTGGGDTIYFQSASGNVVGLYGTSGNWDYVNGSNGLVYLSTAQTNVTGGGDTIYFQSASGNIVGLYGTGGNWDYVYGSNGVVALNTAQANVTGNNDTVYMQGATGNLLGLYGSGETVSFQATFGQSTVSGFSASASDQIALSASDWSNFTALQNTHAISQSGANSLITLDASDTITLTNVLASSLTSAQFKFV